MLRRVIKTYTPNYQTLDTPIEQARAIQDLYDQVRIRYDYLTSPEFDITHMGPPGPPGQPGDKGDPGQSSFDIWKTIPGNEHKTVNDYFNEIKTDPYAYHGESEVVRLSTNIELDVSVEVNKQLNIIYLNNTVDSTVTVTVNSTRYKTPDNLDIVLTIPPNSYGELNVLNINNSMFVRGA